MLLGRANAAPVLLLAASLLWCVMARAEWLRFESLDLDDGLSQLSVMAMLQDQQGFMWFGTQSGLNRYDGYEFRVFRRQYGGGAGGMSDNYVRALAQTPDGIIWIGTGSGGLNAFDPRTETFRVYGESNSELPRDDVRALAVDGDGRLWVGTAVGPLTYVNPGGSTVVPVPGLDPNGVVNQLLVVEDTLWIGAGDGLARMNLPSGEPELLVERAGSGVTALAPDGQGGVWVGTTDGLLHVDDEGTVIERFGGAGDHALPDAPIESLLRDRDGHLWIGTAGGLALMVPSVSHFEVWQHSPLDEYSIAGDQVESLYQDRTGVLWFGSWTGGVSRADLDALVFLGYRAGSGDDELPDSRIRDFVEEDDGSLWVASLGGGLLRLYPDEGRIERFGVTPDAPYGRGSKWLHGIDREEAGALWLGSRDAGLFRFDPATGETTAWPHRPGNPNGPAGNHVLDVVVDDRGWVWAGMLDDGVSRFDPATGEWRHYRHDPDSDTSLPDDTVGHLYLASDGRLLVGTRGEGMAIYRPETDDFLVIPPRPERPGGLLHGNVTYFSESPAGEIWLGTQGGGFGRITAEGEHADDFRFSFVNTSNGVAGDAIGAVLADREGKVWATTLFGITVFDTNNGEIRNYYPLHGTQKRAYYVGAGISSRAGRFYFGGLDGITYFEPKEIAPQPDPPETRLTALHVDNQRVEPSRDDPEALLRRAISFTEEITIGWRSSVFAIEFSGLHFTEPTGNRYEYRLVGFNDDWQVAPSTRRLATYTNLDPSTYTFQVRSANRDAVWSDPVELTIDIEAPPWRTNVAYMVYVISALLLLGLVGWTRRAQLADRLAAEREVQRGKERLELALWGSGDEMWFLNLQSGVLDRMTAENRTDIQTARPIRHVTDVWDQMHPDDREHVRSVMTRHLKGQAPYFEATFRIQGSGGQWIWALSRARAVERDPETGLVTVIAGANKDITQLKNTERALRELNERLEAMVDERTDDLRRTNDDLKRTLDMLTAAQTQLVESEKMASLGNLVAGVAHEINTPVGVALTAATYLQSQFQRLHTSVTSGSTEIDPERIRKQLANMEFLIQNLMRAAELIRSFKQVAVDQSSEERRVFKVQAYVDEILTSLHPRLKRTDHRIEVACDPELEMDSYPGALYQILTNLLMNSLTHGFEGRSEGQIDIEFREFGDSVRLDYRDNGRGFDPEVERRIFEPFFTTRRGEGGSGLGMHIVFNLATKVLGGRISCRGAPGKGIQVVLEMPRSVAERVEG